MKKEIPYNLFNDIVKSAELRKSQIALIDGSDSISYSETLKAAKSAAATLKEAGIKEYAKCILIGNDSPEYIFTAIGILASQGVFVSAGKEITNSKFNELLTQIAIDFAILEESFFEKLIPENYKKCKSFSVGNKHFCIFCKGNSSVPPTPSDLHEQFCKINPAFIRFTSGTTGESKGVVLSHQTIKARTESANSALQITENDHVLWLLPMAYHFAVTIMLFLRKGCTINISVSDSTDAMLAKLENGKASFVYATPYHYGNMIREAELRKTTSKISDSVRLLISTAMPLTEELFANFAKTFNRHLNQAYGIIECGLPCINTSPTKQNGLSVGRHLLGYQLRIAINEDEDRAGEIAIKGPGFFDAYFSPWKKRDKILSKGWFYTGDIGRFNSDGTLIIVGRKKSVINFLGLKIFPEQVEQALLRHPAVSEVRVFGKDHFDFGEIVIAEIVPNPNQKINEIELTKFCAKSLSQQEIPQEFHCVKKISKTNSGKIIR